MDVSEAHESFVAQQSFEWRRWAVAFVQLRRMVVRYANGDIDLPMLDAAMMAIENALAAMIDVQLETLSVIFAVLDRNDEGQHQEAATEWVKPVWPTA